MKSPKERARGEWMLYLAVGLASLGLALVALQVWDADWMIPWSDLGDALPVAAHFKTIFETGWYESQPLLGAPFGQQYHDFPTAETTNFVMAAVLGRLLGDWALAMNVYFVLGFPLAALAAAWFLRVAGASQLATLPLAVLYSILPFHFIQGEPHLFVASYYVVPVGMVLALRAARGEALWGWRRGSAHPIGRWFGRGLQTTAIIAFVGSTDTYFAVFVLIMLATGGVIALLRDRSWRRFAGAGFTGAGIVAVMILNWLPDIIHATRWGLNEGAFVRVPEHAEYFAFKLTQLLLPWSGHQITGLAELRQHYDLTYPLPSEQPALGLVPAIGFVLLIGVLLHRAIRRGHAGGPRSRTLGLLSVLSFIAFCFGVVGGLGSLLSLLTDGMRSWNRIIVVIALLSLAAVALVIDAGMERWVRRADATRGMRRMVGAMLAAILLLVGIIDQTPGTNTHAATQQRFHAQDAWFAGIEASLDAGDWIVQLPYQAFPESHSETGTDGNDVLIPYLHTTRIGWSGGGIKGRAEADWTGVLAAYDPARIPAIAAAAGASGILLDRGATIADWLAIWPATFTAQLGTPLTSDDGRYQYWSLTPLDPERVAAVTPQVLASLLHGREWSP